MNIPTQFLVQPEIRPHPAHDEFRSLGGEARVAPPAQAALDIRVEVGGRGTVVLGMHPGAEQPALEAMPRIVAQQRPGRHIEREPGVPPLGHLVNLGHRDPEQSSDVTGSLGSVMLVG